MLKLCLAAIGTLVGISLPSSGKKPVALVAGSVFIATYIPLMAKFFRIVVGKKDERLPDLRKT